MSKSVDCEDCRGSSYVDCGESVALYSDRAGVVAPMSEAMCGGVSVGRSGRPCDDRFCAWL
jgi:hypothetical protein